MMASSSSSPICSCSAIAARSISRSGVVSFIPILQLDRIVYHVPVGASSSSFRRYLPQGVIAAGRTGSLAEILLPTIASGPLSVHLLHLLQAVVTLHLSHC